MKKIHYFFLDYSCATASINILMGSMNKNYQYWNKNYQHRNNNYQELE